MIRSILTAILLLCSGISSPSLAEEPVTLRVLSYNIHHGEGIDSKLDLERIATVIKSVNPDLVALQEVDKNTFRTNDVDQPEVLSELTGMEVCFERNIKLGDGDYGNAILSRYPIRSKKNVKLPRLNDGEQRGVLNAEIEVPGLPKRLRFLSTHLDHRRAEKERIASAHRINKIAKSEIRDSPAILAGDLNATSDSETLKILKSQWETPDDEVYPTIPVSKPVRQIDYVLFTPGTAWEATEIKVLDEKVASDHRAILVVLKFQAP